MKEDLMLKSMNLKTIHMNYVKIVMAIVCTLLLFGQTMALAEEDLIKGLKKTHPLLLIEDGTWSRLSENRRTDPILDRVLNRVELDSKAILEKAPLHYDKKGKRLLSVSREAIKRILDLAMASKTSKNPELAAKFKNRAEVELLTVASFSDWNPSHFLDVAEMTTAVALGYDWLYDDLSESTRRKIREAILEKAIQQGNDRSLPNTSWYEKEMNWNQVCFGGLAMGALAIANEYPDEARKMLTQVRQNIHFGLKPYAPDGISPEGPGYWAYGTTYQILLNESLKTALDTDWDLWNSPGFRTTGDFLLHMTGPTLRYFNYSDGGDDADVEPAMYKIASKLNRGELLYFQNQLLKTALAETDSWVGQFFPLIAIWTPHFDKPQEPQVAKNWKGEGPQPLAIFRSSWKPDALYLAVKGGSPSLNHAHMDAGSFVLDRNGMRWAVDLGSQDYESLESKNVDLWNRSQKSQRWDVFRIGSISHNTLSIGSTPFQQVEGTGKIIEFEPRGSKPHVILDLSALYSANSSKLIREFSILNRKKVVITDTLAGVKPGERIHWNLTTRANVDLKKRIVTLTELNQKLRLKLIEPIDATWKVRKADPPPHDFDAQNPGVSLITIDYFPKSSRETTIKVMAY